MPSTEACGPRCPSACRGPCSAQPVRAGALRRALRVRVHPGALGPLGGQLRQPMQGSKGTEGGGVCVNEGVRISVRDAVGAGECRVWQRPVLSDTRASPDPFPNPFQHVPATPARLSAPFQYLLCVCVLSQCPPGQYCAARWSLAAGGWTAGCVDPCRGVVCPRGAQCVAREAPGAPGGLTGVCGELHGRHVRSPGALSLCRVGCFVLHHARSQSACNLYM